MKPTAINSASGKNSDKDLPEKLSADFTKYEKLTREQAGHLRYFHNIASAPDGEWPRMGSQDVGQEWLDGYRYQLATMVYASGLAHYHRLPALRSAFKALMKALIRKMLRREVWGYWYLTSQSGPLLDPSLTDLRKPWPDPVCEENIMYSGHLLLMVSLYSMLFDDDSYDEKDSLTFLWNPVFWGFGPQTFSYNRTSLQKAIIDQMERNNWMGVCCEPNLIFVVCNQFPLIAIRYNDIRNGTNEVAEILEKYKEVWSRKSFTGDKGVFREAYLVKQDAMMDGTDIGLTAWGSAMMNSWNSSYTHENFKDLAVGFLHKTKDGRVNLNEGQFAMAIRDVVAQTKGDPDSDETRAKARELVEKQGPIFKLPYEKPLFGYVAHWLSEVGGEVYLNGLLRHADSFMSPAWENGGLYYPRRAGIYDANGNYTAVDPFTGNAAIGYARLNVHDGQKLMWDNPWTHQQLEERPFIDGVLLDSNVDALRGFWDEQRQMMIATFQAWDNNTHDISPVLKNLPVGIYGVYVNGNLTFKRTINGVGDEICVILKVGSQETNLVVVKGAPIEN